MSIGAHPSFNDPLNFGRKRHNLHNKDIKKLIKDGEKFIGHTFKGKYLDCGTMEGYIKSSLEISKIWNSVWSEQVMLD